MLEFWYNISSMKKESKMNNGMIGAIVGDIAGSRFEWHNWKSKRFIRCSSVKGAN
jgi:hypothetical protein